MKHLVEIMGLTWRGTPSVQQDAMLIGGNVIQHNNGITPLYLLDDAFSIAVADGVSCSPKAERASRAALQAVNGQWLDLCRPTNLAKVQQKLCTALADNPTTYGASSTLAIVQRIDEIDGGEYQTVHIQHIGDSRIYRLRPNIGWECMTRDHTVLEDLRETSHIEDGQKYASIYNGLDQYLIADWLYDLPIQAAHCISVTAGDWIVVCTDGVHDLVSCEHWPAGDAQTPLADWLRQLRSLVYKAGADDNGSVIVARWMAV